MGGYGEEYPDYVSPILEYYTLILLVLGSYYNN